MKNKGITLIALIITIIVLLILAGVSIATLTGENGLLQKAAYSKEQSIIGKEKEQISLAWNAVKAEKLGGIVTAEELEKQLNGQATVKEENNKLIITFKETGNIYYIDSEGKINELKGNTPDIDIEKAEITFEYNPEGWTKGPVTVTAKINNEEIASNSEYKIQTTKQDPSVESNWEDTDNQIFTENGEIYARIVDSFGRATTYATGNVEKIDNKAPTIGSVEGSTETGNTGTITVSNITDEESGIAGIYISTESTKPTEETEWTSLTETSYEKTVTENGTYYVWVKDAVGNISDSKTCTISGIVAKVTGITLTDATVYTGEAVTITKTITGSTSYKTIEFTSSNTGVATIATDTGIATGVSAGTSTITCTVTNYDGTAVTGTCTLTVKDPYYSLASKAAIGDYVAYNATNSYSYTSPVGSGPSHGNGSSSQTFTSSSSIKWRVLSTNTSTGEVVLISEAPIGSLTLNGAVGYLYAEQELNSICSIYGYGTGANTSKTFTYQTGDVIEGLTTGTITGSGARSINVDDINAITGYTPSAATTPYTKSIYYPTKTTTTGNSTSAASRSDKHTFYQYTGSDYISGTISDILFKDLTTTSDISYWLASRCVWSFSTNCNFGTRMVTSGNVLGCNVGLGEGLSFSDEPRAFGVRPIVYLKTSVQASGQDSSGAWTIIDK